MAAPEAVPADQRPAAEPVRLPRRKPRVVAAAIVYRLYRLLTRLVGERTMARTLLATSWILNRIAYEEVLRTYGPDRGMRMLRPHTEEFLRRNVPEGSRVLDVGGGPGVFARLLAGIADHVTYVDIVPERVERARRRTAGLDNVSFACGDGFSPPGSDRYDVAVLLHVLEHVDDPVASLRRLRTRAGRVLIEVPDLESMPHLQARIEIGAPYHWDDDHVSEFTAPALADSLAAAGWRTRSVERVNWVLLAVAEGDGD